MMRWWWVLGMVTVSRELHVDVDELEFDLTVRNGSGAPLRLDTRRLRLDVGAWAPFVPLDGDGDADGRQLELSPGASGTLAVRFTFRQTDQLVLQFQDAISVGGSPWPLPAIELLRPGERLQHPRASRLNLGLRLLGGALISETISTPLAPRRFEPAAFLGPLEGYVGFWFRWVELNLVLRAGAGRLVGVEVGVRPGLEALTVYAGYGLDLVSVPLGFQLSGGSSFGHGPRAGLEVALGSGAEAFGVRRPPSLGLVVMAGATALAGPSTPAVWTPFFEGGLRWRWR
jgi:hypothetical protein